MRGGNVFIRRRLGAVAALLVIVFACWLATALLQPFTGSGHGRVTVTIPKDATASEVGSLLAQDGVISSSFFFKLRAALAGDRSKLLAGTYQLKLGMSYGAVLSELTNSRAAVSTVETVTIIPGRSREQVQEELKSAGVKGNYVAATVSSSVLDPTTYGAPKDLPSLEGFLWPDTYELTKPVKLTELIDDQLTRFKQEFATVNLTYATSKKLTAYDVLKIASLISEEAMLPGDLPKAASVIYNRLRLGMNLGLDSTVAYATGNYGTLTEQNLDSKSPWNTTNHPGLPPTPIDSPDLAAIHAAAHPSHTDDLYFINKVCGNGALRFTANYMQFEKWSAAWDIATSKAQSDGDSPEFCGKSKKGKR